MDRRPFGYDIGPMNTSLQGRSKRNGVPFGQATLEYVLILLIAVILAGGLMYQFNRSFQAYFQAMFKGENSYLFCLIQNGILPFSDGDVCPAPQLSPSQKPSVADQGDSGSGGGSGGSGKGSNAKNSGKGSKGEGSGGGTGKADESSKGLIGFSNADRRRAGMKSTSESEGKEKKANTGNNGVSSSGAPDSGGGGESVSANNSSFYRRRSIQEESEKQKASSTVPMTGRDMKTAREIAADKNKKKTKTVEEEVQSLSFSNVFKYLIIALLIFGILFFVGGQFVAVSRSKKRK